MRLLSALIFVVAAAAVTAAAPPYALPGMELALTPSQAVQSLVVGDFEMVPNSTHVRSRLGDVALRVSPGGAAGGQVMSLTTADPSHNPKGPPSATPIVPLPAGELAAATVQLFGGNNYSLTLERHYAAAADKQGLRMWFVLKNSGAVPVEVLSWSATMGFMDMLAPKAGPPYVKQTSDTMAATLVMVDPAICGQHGFVSVTRMTGEGAALVVVPEGGTDFQAFPNESPPQLMSLSKGHAQAEWINATGAPWVKPSSVVLKPGASQTFAYRLLVADSLRAKDAALAVAGFAVLQAVPSYSIGTDMKSALLHVLPPRGATIASTKVEPAGILTLGKTGAVYSNGFYALPVQGLTAGRARVTISYSDGTSHHAAYFVMPPLNKHVQKYSKFLAETAWYANTSDPFGRGHSVLAWNRKLKKHIGVGPWDNGYEDDRIFNNGLSDEAGAGTHVGLGAVVGGSVQPSDAAKLDLYINDTLYGIKPGLPFGASLQCVEGEEGSESPSCGPAEAVGPTTNGVMASMFWVPCKVRSKGNAPVCAKSNESGMPGYDYDPRWDCQTINPDGKVNNTKCQPGWPDGGWDQARGASLSRAYNYAHVSSQYLGMYQAAVYDQLKTIKPRLWYLERAYKTIVSMNYQASWYTHQGLMDGTNFRTILFALEDEGLTKEASLVREIMENRTVTGVHNTCRFYGCPTDDTSAECNATRNESIGTPNYGYVDRGNDKPGCHWYLKENVASPWANQTGLPGAGSEFSWDSTGQEEAYIWGAYFNVTELAQSALNQILAYTPLVPNWAWHGSAYSYGDFGNNGWLSKADERGLQHYRSGLNSIPTTEAFLSDPTDLYLLRLAAGSISGVLTNIDATDGAPAMAYHGDPKLMEWDPVSGDHGLSMYGHSHNTQSFLIKHPVFGDLCYFCDVAKDASGVVTVTPRDSYRRTVYLAELGLQIRSDAGTIAKVEVDTKNGGSSGAKATVFFNQVGTQPLSQFRLRLLCRSSVKGHCSTGHDSYKPAAGLIKSQGAYTIKPEVGVGGVIISSP